MCPICSEVSRKIKGQNTTDTIGENWNTPGWRVYWNIIIKTSNFSRLWLFSNEIIPFQLSQLSNTLLKALTSWERERRKKEMYESGKGWRCKGKRENSKSREIYKNPGVVERKDIKKDLPLNKWKSWIKILEEMWDLLLEFRISSKRYTRRLGWEKERNARRSPCYAGWIYAIEIVVSNPPVHELYYTGFWKKTAGCTLRKN